MFAAPNHHPGLGGMPPVMRHRPTPYSGYQGPSRLPLNMQIPSQFNFGNTNMPQTFASNAQSNHALGTNDISKLPNKAMYPPSGMNTQQSRPNSAGSSMYPNNMYPSHLNNQPFNAAANSPYSASALPHSPAMNMNTPSHDMHLNPAMRQGYNNSALPTQQQHMGVVRSRQGGAMNRQAADNTALDTFPTPSQYSSGHQSYMNQPRAGMPQNHANRMNSMGLASQMPSASSYGNGQSVNGQYAASSQYGPSQAYARQNSVGYSGGNGALGGDYRTQSPGVMSANGGGGMSTAQASHMRTAAMPGSSMNMLMGSSFNQDPATVLLNSTDTATQGAATTGPPGSLNAMNMEGGVPGMAAPNASGSGSATRPRERLRAAPAELMQQILSDRSCTFRTHPLFPLLRDLIIADMNFNTPSFPFQLIANLPADFDKLLQNYLNRNPSSRNQHLTTQTDSVLMDALKYAHQSIIDKIQSKKEEAGYAEPKPLSAIEDFCERFDRAVQNSFTKPVGSPQTTPSKPPRTPSKSSGSSSTPAPSTPKKEASRTDSERSTGTPSGKGATAGRNKVLPKEAVAFMLDWLREHHDNPYPNDDEKEMLITNTKLTINQINYWFTNARRRILPKWALQRYLEQQQNCPYPPRLPPPM